MVEVEARNEVVLVGRVAAHAEQRELPSGDLLTSWRLVVERGVSRRPVPEGIRPPTVDTLECVAWTAQVQRSAASWQPGDVVQVEGSLRRRFWRAPTGSSSRYEIEVVKAKRIAKVA